MRARTAEDVARRILCAVYVARDRTREVADPDVQRHTHAALVVAREVVAKPTRATLVCSSVSAAQRDAPCDDSGEAGIRARDDEEGAKVLDADGHVRDVDREADEAVDEPGQDEWVALLDPVGPDGPDQERQG